MNQLPRISIFTLALLATNALASFHTFKIHELYTNADGTIQYIVMHENEGFRGEDLWERHVLTSSHSGRNVLEYTFLYNLPTIQTASMYVLIATQPFADLGLIKPDYIIPNGFLPTDAGGVLNFADVDAWEYGQLPTDGDNALYANSTAGLNVARNFNGQFATVKLAPVTTPTTPAVEYYYADWNYYFVTSFPTEIALLDGGAFNGNWKRTGESFSVWPESTATSSPACRFFSTSFAPRSSHFYTPFAAECTTVKANPDWQYESVAFHLELANASGLCGGSTIPLYRLYNKGMGGAPNHRYTSRLDVFNAMIAAGWDFEGDGNTKVFACVPK
ncbi:MAG: hypothetical protein ABI624_00340 [Casimicrobiaceae bacterium]